MTIQARLVILRQRRRMVIAPTRVCLIHPLVDSKNTVNQTQHLTHLGALGCLTELWDKRVVGAVKVLQIALFEIIQEMLCNNFVFKRCQFSFYRAF